MIIIPPTNATVQVNVQFNAKDLKQLHRVLTYCPLSTDLNTKADTAALLSQFDSLLTQNGVNPIAL